MIGQVMTYNEIIKETRQICRNIGVTFKRANHDRNGMAAYIFVLKSSGVCIHNGSFTANMAWDNALAGNVENWAAKEVAACNIILGAIN